MTRRSPLFLATAALLFAGWMAWLGYLALTTTRPEVLSRPQFLASQVDIIADVDGDAEAAKDVVTVKNVAWQAREITDPPKVGAPLKIVNLPRVFSADGWTGPGEYLLPLTYDTKLKEYRLAPVLYSPGLPRSQDRPRIYHATPPVLAQQHKLREQ